MTDASISGTRPAPLRPVRAAARGMLAFWGGADVVLRLALLLTLALVLAALLGPVLAPHDPNTQSLLARLRPPIGFERAREGFFLGTDELGRDMLSRSLHGLRLTMTIALSGALIGLLLGGSLGMVAGLIGGRIDAVVMSLVDLQIAVPFTLIAILAVALLGGDLPVLIMVLGIAYWEQYARILRGEVLRLREMPFIEAARAAGATRWRIARRHVLPNIVSPAVVMFTLNFSNIVLLESTLSFLGLGLRPPTATLGSMVGMGRDYMPSAPWIVAVPALLIVAVTLCVQLLGDALRDRVDVRLKDR